MKKILLSFLLIVPIFSHAHEDFLSSEELSIHYYSENNNQKYSDAELNAAILNGLNYWQDCIGRPISFSKEKSVFKVTWTDELHSNEYADVLFTKKFNDVIEFNIQINNQKQFSLKNIKYLVGHEVGHILNIPHTLDKTSVMYFEANKMLGGEINQIKDNKKCSQTSQEELF